MRESLIGTETPIHVTKYDGSYHRRIPARYVVQHGPVHLVTIEPGTIMTRTPEADADPAPYRFPRPADVFLFEDRWFHFARERIEGGMVYKIDIATPVEFDGAAFHFVDLDLDVVWEVGSDPVVEDEDEFLDHGQAMRYPADVIERARAAVSEVLELIEARAFPFDRA